MLYDALVEAETLELRAAGAAVLRRQARRPSGDPPGRDQPADDSRGAPRPSHRAAEVRRSVRLRPRRRRSPRARGRRRSLRGRPRRLERDCGAAARRHSGHPPRACVGVRRGLGPRRVGLRAGARLARARQRDRRRADGPRESRGDCRRAARRAAGRRGHPRPCCSAPRGRARKRGTALSTPSASSGQRRGAISRASSLSVRSPALAGILARAGCSEHAFRRGASRPRLHREHHGCFRRSPTRTAARGCRLPTPRTSTSSR